jgi:hypothetical protein
MISILIQNEYVLMVSCGVARASGCPASRSPHTPGVVSPDVAARC